MRNTISVSNYHYVKIGELRTTLTWKFQNLFVISSKKKVIVLVGTVFSPSQQSSLAFPRSRRRRRPWLPARMSRGPWLSLPSWLGLRPVFSAHLDIVCFRQLLIGGSRHPSTRGVDPLVSSLLGHLVTLSASYGLVADCTHWGTSCFRIVRRKALHSLVRRPSCLCLHATLGLLCTVESRPRLSRRKTSSASLSSSQTTKHCLALDDVSLAMLLPPRTTFETTVKTEGKILESDAGCWFSRQTSSWQCFAWVWDAVPIFATYNRRVLFRVRLLSLDEDPVISLAVRDPRSNFKRNQVGHHEGWRCEERALWENVGQFREYVIDWCRTAIHYRLHGKTPLITCCWHRLKKDMVLANRAQGNLAQESQTRSNKCDLKCYSIRRKISPRSLVMLLYILCPPRCTRTHTHFSRTRTTAHASHISCGSSVTKGQRLWFILRHVVALSSSFTSSLPDYFVFTTSTNLFTFSVLYGRSCEPSSIHQRTRSLEGVWPTGRLRPNHRLWAQPRRLLQLHGHSAHADPFSWPRRRHDDSRKNKRLAEFRSIQQQHTSRNKQSSKFVRFHKPRETG